MGKLSVMWDDGIYLGVKGSSGEIIIGNPKGAWKTRSVQRKPADERWPEDADKMVVYVPWNVSAEDPEAHGELRLPEVVRLEGQYREAEEDGPELSMPRRFPIEKKDLNKHGYSMDCPGCSAILRGLARQGHSEACRKRLELAMKSDEKVRESKKRAKEFTKMAIESEDEKRKKTSTDQQGGQASQSTASGSGEQVTSREVEM